MPYLWTTTDTRNAVLASLLPGASGLIFSASILGDKAVHSFVKNVYCPKWAAISDERICVALDVATAAPLGYASYLVYKVGGGFEYSDTTTALGVYGANLLGVCLLVPCFKAKSLSAVTLISTLNAITAATAACLFGRIEKRAGYFLVPYALWSAYYAAMALCTHCGCCNSKNASKNIA